MNRGRAGRAGRLVGGGALLLAALVAAGGPTFQGGTGTAADPYQIATVEQLQQMRHNLAAHYVLVADMDAAGAAGWDEGRGFTPVGDAAQAFTGSFDGRGHTIRGLTIKRFAPVTTRIALFGQTGSAAAIRNVQLTQARVEGCDHVGALVGINQGTLSGCYASGEVHGSGSFGGLVGVNDGGRLTHCAAAVKVAPVWVGNHLGGLAGGNSGTITDCFATGEVNGLENAGGLVGVNSGEIRRCYAAGAVASSFTGASDEYRRGAGGLVAQNGGGTIADCFATGTVTGPDGLPVGGLVGINVDRGVIGNSCFLTRGGGALAGVGRSYPEAGAVDCRGVAAIDAALFQPGGGRLASWQAGQVWTGGGVGANGLPLFAFAYATETPSGRAAGQGGSLVELTDGSRLVGTLPTSELTVVGALGRVQMPLAQVVSLTTNADGETVTLRLSNGDRLSGVVDTPALELETSWARLRVPLKYLRALDVAGGSLDASTPFDARGVDNFRSQRPGETPR